MSSLARWLWNDKRLALAAGLIVTHVWRFHDLTPQLAQLRIAALFTLSSWVVLALSPNWSSLGGAIRRPYAVAFLLWSTWMLIGMPGALAPDNTWAFLTSTHSKNVLLYLFLVSTFWGFRRLKIGLLTNVAGAWVLAFFYIKGGMPGWGTPVPMYDVNDLALLLTMTLPLGVWAAVTVGRKKWERAFLWTAVLAFILAVTGTGSRGGFLALCTVLLFMMFRFRAVPRSAKTALVVGAGVLLIAAPQSYWDRMSTILDPSQDYNMQSDVGRIEIWKRGLGYARENPLTGIGAQNFPIAEGTLRPEARSGEYVKWSAAHSSYVQALAETGYVGFALWLGMIFTAFVRVRATRRTLGYVDPVHRAELVRLLDALTVSLIAFTVGGFFLSQAYAPYLLVVLALLAGVEGTVDRVRATPKGRAGNPSARAARGGSGWMGHPHRGPRPRNPSVRSPQPT